MSGLPDGNVPNTLTRSYSIAAEVEMRATVDAKRAAPRFAVRFLTGMTIGLLAYGIDRLLFFFQRGLFPYRVVEE